MNAVSVVSRDIDYSMHFVVESDRETDETNIESRERVDTSRSNPFPSATSLDERYLRQLKHEILYLNQLTHEKNVLETPQTRSHNHHIKNVQKIREHKQFLVGIDVQDQESLRALLGRYNYSLDPAQVRVCSPCFATKQSP